ncbi:TrbC/VirB2 family protein [Sphingobium sp. AN558]|uniref:TrbC/VirB2 family protein n=1 Tax=Sphingobium sp. AN558 TaxID=3133442 RepID=UPI0030BBBF3F
MNGSSSIVAATDWISDLLTGSMAASVAVVAVAACGFAMMRGQLNWTTAAKVILGCTIIFGASQIAQGLMAFATVGRPPPARLVTGVDPLPISRGVTRKLAADATALAQNYALIHSAVAARFPDARGIIRLRVATGDEGEMIRVDVDGDGVNEEIKAVVARIIAESGLYFTERNSILSLPDVQLQ